MSAFSVFLSSVCACAGQYGLVAHRVEFPFVESERIIYLQSSLSAIYRIPSANVSLHDFLFFQFGGLPVSCLLLFSALFFLSHSHVRPIKKICSAGKNLATDF